MTTITAVMLMTLAMTVALVPKTYWSYIMKGRPAELQTIQEQRGWVLRHLRCSLVVLVLVWMAMAYPAIEVPGALAAAAAIYAASSLLLVVLESLLAQRIDGMLESAPVRVRVRD
jgi:hypothetical protein